MNMPVPFQQGVKFGETIWFWVVAGVALAVTAVIAVILFKGNSMQKIIKTKQRKQEKRNRRTED